MSFLFGQQDAAKAKRVHTTTFHNHKQCMRAINSSSMLNERFIVSWCLRYVADTIGGLLINRHSFGSLP